MEKEIKKIVDFIKENFSEDEKAVIAVSGGLDSDVVTRLAYKALGKTRIKIFIVIQEDMEKSHLENARDLAKELGLNLVEIELQDIPYIIVSKVEEADKEGGFNKDGFLDTARTKVALRTVINSMYQDKGYKVVGTSNKTEIELGFFLPFGDGIAHLKPIAHLYKTDVFKIARELGSNDKVLNQNPSAGLWEGEQDLEDISYWIFNEAPIQREIDFSESDIKKVENIYKQLTIEKIDLALSMIAQDINSKIISDKILLNIEIIDKLKSLVINSKKLKTTQFNKQIDND